METTIQDFKLTTLVISSVFIILFLVVSAVESNSVVLNGYSTVLLCAVICIGIQWIAWIPASIWKTERFYDLTGGLTFLVVVVFSLWSGSQFESPSLREIIVSALVVVWSLRLSSFLIFVFIELEKMDAWIGSKHHQYDFLYLGLCKAFGVSLTMVVVIVINNQENASPALGIWDCIGFLLWIIGFGIEVIADNQKTIFNSDPNNKDKWIDSGLWSYSRHPKPREILLDWSIVFRISCFTGLEKVDGYRQYSFTFY